MKPFQLTIDGMLSGTGLRDAVEGGYVDPAELGLSEGLCARITDWLARYEDAHYRQFVDEAEVAVLDQEGLQIRDLVSVEMPDAKVGYFSNARMKAVV